MLDKASIPACVARLRQAACDDTLSEHVRRHASSLSDRLERGVRVVLLGPPGVGKSSVCDALLGMTVPRTAGETCVVGGSSEAVAFDTLTASAPIDPVGSRLASEAQFIDPDFDHERQTEQTQELLRSADIVLWCTEAFTAEEANCWREASDHLKDHSFLVLTKADIRAAEGSLQDRIAAMTAIADEEFHSFFPVSTLQLSRLQMESEDIPEHVLAASGVKSLIDTVTGLVTSGQRADLDSAMLFMQRNDLGLDALLLSPTDAPEPAPDEPPEDTHRAREALFQARDKVLAKAYDLAELGFDEAEGDMTEVLDLCITMSEDLAADMRDLSDEYPQFADLSGSFENAVDKITLMAMENDTRSAADAVTILVQLRHDLEQVAFY